MITTKPQKENSPDNFDSLVAEQKYTEKILRNDESVFSVEISIETSIINDPIQIAGKYIMSQQDKLTPYTTQKLKEMKSKGKGIVRKNTSGGKYKGKELYFIHHKIQVFHNELHIRLIQEFEQVKQQTMVFLKDSCRSDYVWSPDTIHDIGIDKISNYTNHPLETVITQLSVEDPESDETDKLGSFIAQLIFADKFVADRFTIFPRVGVSHFRENKPELYIVCLLNEKETDFDTIISLPACALLKKYDQTYFQFCTDSLKYCESVMERHFYDNELGV